MVSPPSQPPPDGMPGPCHRYAQGPPTQVTNTCGAHMAGPGLSAAPAPCWRHPGPAPRPLASAHRPPLLPPLLFLVVLLQTLGPWVPRAVSP